MPESIIGRRFGMQVVIHAHPTIKRLALVRCDCGREHYTHTPNLYVSKSCGCIKVKHGLTGTPEFKIWCGIRKRCLAPKSTRYRYYGGRGIKMCRRWLIDFNNFLMDMGPRPSPKHSIDRINNNGNYTARNCRWATQFEQIHNSRNVRILTAFGKSQCLAMWAREYGIGASTLRHRIFKQKLPIHIALTK